jgi:ABC-type multidrug transport system fused ATPase/permease subunit
VSEATGAGRPALKGGAAEDPQRGMRAFAGARRYWPAVRREFLWGLLCVLPGSALDLLSLLVIRDIVDGVTTADAAARMSFRDVLMRSLLVLAMTLVKGAAKYGMRYWVTGASRVFERLYRQDLFQHLLTLTPRDIGHLRTGDIMSRSLSDIEAVRMLLGPAAMYNVQTLVVMPMALVTMALIDPLLTALMTLPFLGLALVVKVAARPTQRWSQASQDRIGDLSTVAQESFSGIRVVKAFASEAFSASAFRRMGQAFLHSNVKLATIRGLTSATINVVKDFGMLLIVLVGGWHMVQGRLTLGNFVLFSAMLNWALWPLIAVGWTLGMYHRARAGALRLNELFAIRSSVVEAPDAITPPAVRGELEVRHLSFSWGVAAAGAGDATGAGGAGGAVPATEVLVDVSLRVPAGGTVGITGRTGCGKSTLVQLLSRQVEPPPGTVFLDGHDVRTLSLSFLRRSIGVVPQDSFLFSESIAANIGYAHDDADLERARHGRHRSRGRGHRGLPARLRRAARRARRHALGRAAPAHGHRAHARRQPAGARPRRLPLGRGLGHGAGHPARAARDAEVAHGRHREPPRRGAVARGPHRRAGRGPRRGGGHARRARRARRPLRGDPRAPAARGGDRGAVSGGKDHHDAEQDLGSLYDPRLLSRVLEFARPHRGALLATVGLLVVGLLLKLAGPKIVQLVIDGPVKDAAAHAGDPTYALGAPLEQVTRLGLLFLLLAVANAAVLVVREWLMNRTGQQIVYEVRDRLFAHVLRLPVGWYDRHAVGWTVTRSTSDVDSLSELFTTGVATLAYDVLTIIVVAGVLIWISPPLAAVALLMLPVMMWISFRFRLKARVAYRATRASIARLNAYLQERLSGLAVVRLFRREEASARRFEVLNTKYYSDNMLTVRHFSLFFPTVDTLSVAVKLGCLVYGSWLIGNEQLAIGVFVQFWLYLDFVFEPIRELAERYNILQAAMAAAERIFGVLDTRAEDAPPLAIEVGKPATDGAAVALPGAVAVAADGAVRGEAAAVLHHPAGRVARAAGAGAASAIEFRHVSFSYGGGAPVLQDVSFSVAPGERVAVVGHTGAGKTTLVSLLCRFHDIVQGQVLVHGRDIAEVPHQELRRGIAVVQQDVFLFSDSISANIRMGQAGMSDDAVARAATAVHADGFVRRLPQGYDTVLQERGANLSTGQRQLIAFARALAADPDILVLDEATSSVDSETEALIEDATARLMQGRTSLVIAHRLSTVVNADRILVMHKGRVHEQGTHEELMEQRGLYWKLYRLHLAGAASA